MSVAKAETKGGIPADDVLLCERCGYVLDATPREGMCPECGKPVAESLPERRVGSAWQERPTWSSLARTAWLVHRRPGGVWDLLRTTAHDQSPANVGCTLATLPAVLMVGLHVPRPTSLESFALAALALYVLFSVCWLVLYLLTYIETRGVEFFSKRRGWRVPRELAWAICSHAALAWWVATTILTVTVWQAESLERWVSFVLPASLRAAFPPVRYVVPLAAFAFGMLVFETLVYQGVRACRFANVPAASEGGSKRDRG